MNEKASTILKSTAGQTRSVIVQRLPSKDTVDRRIFDLMMSKKEVFDCHARDSALKESANEAVEKRLIQEIIEEEQRRSAG